MNLLNKESIEKSLITLTLIMFIMALTKNEYLSKLAEITKWIILFISIGYYSKKFYRKSSHITIFLYTAFLASLTVGTLINNEIIFKTIIDFTPYLIIFLLYFSLSKAINKKPSLFEYPVKIISITITLTSIPFIFTSDAYTMNRFDSYFINTNVIAGILAISITFFFYQLTTNKKKIYIFFLFVASTELLLTKGRTSLIALTVPIAIMLMINFNIRKLMKLKFIFSYLAILFVFVFLAINLNFTDTYNVEDENNIFTLRTYELGARADIADTHLTAFIHSPIFGAGVLIDKENPYARSSGESSYTDILSMAGIVGIIPIILIIYLALLKTYKLKETNSQFYVLISCLILSIGEGYITGIGSFISIITWSILLQEFTSKNNENKINYRQK